MSSESGSSKEKHCRVIIQQCLKADLRFDTDDAPVSIQNGMVVFACFLNKATTECLDSIVKSILNAKLCEPEEHRGRVSLLECNFNMLVIPQATLGGKLKGKTIQYHGIVGKSVGEELFAELVIKLKESVHAKNPNAKVVHGVYGARQILQMETNGPFTHFFEF